MELDLRTPAMRGLRIEVESKGRCTVLLYESELVALHKIQVDDLVLQLERAAAWLRRLHGMRQAHVKERG